MTPAIDFIQLVGWLFLLVFGSLALCMLLAWASVIVSGKCSDEEREIRSNVPDFPQIAENGASGRSRQPRHD